MNFKNPNKIASLSDNAFLRYFNFVALYFAQGLPEGMLFFGIPAWMAMNGKSPGEIASFAVVCGLPWSFKFIVAPLMDRYSYLPMGRKRPWVILGQLGLISSSIAMAFVPDPLNNLNLLMASGFIISFFGSFQDVATDGMAVDILPVDQQARANGLMWGSKIIGTSVSLALGSWLLSKYNFSTAILSLSAMIAVIMLVPIFLRERQGEKILPWTAGVASPAAEKLQIGSWKTIFKTLYSVFKLPNSLLLALVLFITAGAYNFLDTLLPIFTVKELGWTNVVYSQYYSTATVIGGIGGMLIGGFLIDRFGKKRMLNIYFFLLLVITAVFTLLLKPYWNNTSVVFGFMVVYNIIYTFATIGILAMAMQCCWRKVSASQFTLYMTINNVGRIALVALIGPIKAMFSWEITLLMFAVFIALAWILFQYMNLDRQTAQVSELEKRDMESKVLELAPKQN